LSRAQKTRLTAPEQSNLATDSDTATSSSGGRARAAGYIAEIAIAQSRIGEAAPMEDFGLNDLLEGVARTFSRSTEQDVVAVRVLVAPDPR
jgi:hypothetical protein